MEQLTLSEPQKVIEAIKSGRKIAVFAVEEGENEKPALGYINLQVSTVPTRENELLGRAIKFIERYYNKDIRLKTLAALCDLSPEYFSRVFTKTYGKCLTAYITDLRMERACKLLSATSRTAAAISAEVGYPDCGYFYKLFKKKYGMTPLQYRKSVLL